MQNNYRTDRLLLNGLTPFDADFILELVNTPEWIQYIGDRNIRTKEDARAYIQKIIENSTSFYWVVTLRDQHIPIGIITFIKRNYLNHHDIGFAFLPKFTKQGFAYEATEVVLNDLIKDHSIILATTFPENKSSIQLLKKLGFAFHKEIVNENQKLLLYSVTTDTPRLFS